MASLSGHEGDALSENVGPSKRRRIRKRHDDTLRAEKSVLEKHRKALLRKKKRNSLTIEKNHDANKASKQGKQVMDRKAPPKKIPKLDSKSRLIALAQAEQIEQIGKPAVTSTPSDKPGTIETLTMSAINPNGSPKLQTSDSSDRDDCFKIGGISGDGEGSDNQQGFPPESTKPSMSYKADDEDGSDKKSKHKTPPSKNKKKCFSDSNESESDKESKRKTPLSKTDQYNFGDSSVSGSDNESKRKPLPSNTKKNDSGDSSESETDSDSDSSTLSSDESDSKRRRLTDEEYQKQLRYQKGDRGTTQLFKTGFYVNKNGYDSLVMRGKSHTSIARGLLDLLFTEDAAVGCSLLGGDQRGPKGKTDAPRPGLYPEAVQALKDAAKEICLQKKIPLEPLTNLHKQLGTRLCEVRNAVKKKLAFEAKLMEKRRKKEKKAAKEKKKKEKKEKEKIE